MAENETDSGTTERRPETGGLLPAPGFDWSKVKWGAPLEAVSELCSYCGEKLNDHPLRLFTGDGWAAAFCAHCQTEWFGLQLFDDEPDADDGFDDLDIDGRDAGDFEP